MVNIILKPSFSRSNCATADLISTSGEVDLSITGKYHIVSNYKFAEATESDLIVTFNNGGSSAGAATIVMSYV